MNFIDNAKIYVQSGDGGNGCIAFLREKFRPKGGPCGGDGGHGGDIVFIADSNLSTLHDIAYKKKYYANRGSHGKGKNMHGKNGQDIIISIPPGTIIKNADTEQVLEDLTKAEQKFIAAKGGNGGFGNARFKNNVQTAPRIANDGQKGEKYNIALELKVLADVGLVGFPNTGKSTFISKISNAKPKIADYPFTTLVPNLGIVKYGNYQSFVLADIPGLIKGAAEGKGLGNNFLKHIERTKILVYMLDCISDDINADYFALKNELKNHNPQLLNKPSLILITKSDLLTEDLINSQKLIKASHIKISSITNFNIENATLAITKLLESKFIVE